jgi:nucleotide-binding universal stress UspA family protein
VTGDPGGQYYNGYVWENGCGLIVRGAYARTPGGPLIVGPVVRDLFGQMTVPVVTSP